MYRVFAFKHRLRHSRTLQSFFQRPSNDNAWIPYVPAQVTPRKDGVKADEPRASLEFAVLLSVCLYVHSNSNLERTFYNF